MPELPEVETVASGLRQHLVGKTIKQALVRRYDLRFPIDRNFAQIVQGQEVIAIHRRAKYLLIHLSNRQVIIGHLGMSGRIMIHHPGERVTYKTHDHVIIECTDSSRIIFNDPRRFGAMSLAAASELDQHPLLVHLGVEPFGSHFSAEYVMGWSRKSTMPIKTWLMNAKFIVGIGNIYACEILFKLKIHPEMPVKQLTQQQAEALVEITKEVLAAAIKAGGSTLKDYAQVSGELGYFQHQFLVYGRAKQPCYVCQQPIAIITQSGRSSFYCPNCQK